jgi:hypothetical protein
MFMYHLHAQFHFNGANGEIDQKAKRCSHGQCIVSNFTKKKTNKGCIFLEDLLPYIIS